MAAHISYRVETLNDYSAKPSSPRTFWGLEPGFHSYAKHLWYDWTLNSWSLLRLPLFSSDYCHVILPNHLAWLQTHFFKWLLFRTTLRAFFPTTCPPKHQIFDYYMKHIVSESKNLWWLKCNTRPLVINRIKYFMPRFLPTNCSHHKKIGKHSD